MTDFHAHFLPAVDDGSDGVTTSLRMLELWREQQIERICATPHFYAERTTPERFLRRRESAYKRLTAAMEEGEEYPRILLGAEVRFFNGISAKELPELCLEGTNLLLLEMPFTRWTERILGEVADICRRNIVPVAAHLERYVGFNNNQILNRFTDLDILVQCNAEYFISRRSTRKALSMLRDGRVHFLGSDAHNIKDRAPNLGSALVLIRKKLGDAALERLQSTEVLIDGGREAPEA